jgi:arabinogalactan endo-1,4-beta-galactosidase
MISRTASFVRAAVLAPALTLALPVTHTLAAALALMLTPTRSFAVTTGADLSFTPQLVSLGAEYRVDGEPVNLLDASRDAGFGIVRLRLWHTPAEPWHGLDATVAFAQEVKARGLDLMLDIHYSDTWADPGHQTKPAAWAGVGALVDSVYAYTNAVVRRLRDAGALPEYVQVGNEISAGTLWDDGRVGWQGSEWDTDEQWDRFAALVSAGVAGARDSLAPSERPAVIVHFDNGGNNAGCRWFFDNLLARGVSFDAIGLSYYPWWHGGLAGLEANLADLAARYGREVMVVETGYPWTLGWHDQTHNFVGEESQLLPGYPATPEGQLAFLQEVVATVEEAPGGLGTAVLYWEPGFLCVPGGPPDPYENVTLFDFDGDALPGFRFSLPWASGVTEHADDETLSLSHGSPNPFGDTTAFVVAVPEPGGRLRAVVHDVAGRVVAVLADGPVAAGGCPLRWDGRDASGEPVAAGVYLLDVGVDGRRVARKVVRVR